jgi:hypothetical protein
MDHILDAARQRPVASALSCLYWLGYPPLFFFYFLAMSNNTNADGVRVLGVPTFRRVAFNTSRMNFGLYVMAALPVCLSSHWVQLKVLPGLVRALLGRELEPGDLCRQIQGGGDASTLGALASIPNPALLNLLAWSTTGMEGNVMGFAAVPFLVLPTIQYSLQWMADVWTCIEKSSRQSHAWERSFDRINRDVADRRKGGTG